MCICHNRPMDVACSTSIFPSILKILNIENYDSVTTDLYISPSSQASLHSTYTCMGPGYLCLRNSKCRTGDSNIVPS